MSRPLIAAAGGEAKAGVAHGAVATWRRLWVERRRAYTDRISEENVQTTLTVSIDETLAARLIRLEALTGRSRDSLVAEALRGFVGSEEAFAAAVEEGRADIAAGRTVDHAAVVARFEEIVGRTR